MRLLRAIERATRQQMRQLQLPSLQTITAKRVAQFNEHLLTTLAEQDLAFFQNTVEELGQTQGIAIEKIAAALAYLVQKERPLQSFHSADDDEEPMDEDTGYRGRGRRDARDGRRGSDDGRGSGYKKRVHPQPGEGVVRYRIEVGRNQGVMPKDIVGAIANEAGIEYDHIGYIGLEADYSTVDLPEGMPKEVFQHLKKIRVRQHPLNISVHDGKTHAPDRSATGEFRRPAGKEDGFDSMRRKRVAADPRKPRSEAGAGRAPKPRQDKTKHRKGGKK
jgi:ATP-dependent RNA helicase DeaD